MRKQFLASLMALFLCFPLFQPCAQAASTGLPTLGVCIYNMEDTFIASLLNVIRAQAQNRAELEIRDAQNNQNLQNDQLEELLKMGVSALILNPVDRTTAVYQLQMAMQYDTPIVFINREPLQQDLDFYSKAYYVGIDPKQQGLLAGQLAAEYFLSHKEADQNSDGRMQLVLFKGEPGHQDAELRTVYAIKALQDSGVLVELLSEETASWQRSLAQERMATLLNAHGNRIECVIANNDDMALGAIDALKAAGYFTDGRYLPVIGNDATSPALEALRHGSLYATVTNNAELQGAAALSLALLLANGNAVTPKSFPYEIDEKVVYVHSTYYRTNLQP